MRFDGFGCIFAPLPGLLIYLGIDVELVQEGMHADLVISGHDSGFKIIGKI